MPDKCYCCGKTSTRLFSTILTVDGEEEKARICGPDCESWLRGFMEYMDEKLNRLFFSFMGSVFTGVFLTLAFRSGGSAAIGVFIVYAGTGASLVNYPLVPFPAIKDISAQKAVVMAQWIGWINITLGVLFLYLAL